MFFLFLNYCLQCYGEISIKLGLKRFHFFLELETMLKNVKKVCN